MPKGYTPAIFVSSTCYDLSQIRADLKIFIESLGYDPVLSEFNSFPVNPDYDTISNCLENVKARADIFILIVGGRYGFQTDNGKSVTNLEYLEAKSKGIPAYIFVAKSIVTIMPIWVNNKSGDYCSIVDTPLLFEFIETLKSKQENWVYTFETAQDIIQTLKTQLAYLFMDSLEIRKKFSKTSVCKEISDLSPKAFEIAMQKPKGWEYRLFAQVLRDGIIDERHRRYDLEFGVSFGKTIFVGDVAEFGNWFSVHSGEIKNAVISISSLLNSGLKKAVGEPGVEGELQMIVYVARRIVEGYTKLIEWSLEFKRIESDEKLEKIIEIASKMSSNAIHEIEDYSENAYYIINDAIDNPDKYQEGTNLTLSLSVPDMTEFYSEINKLKAQNL